MDFLTKPEDVKGSDSFLDFLDERNCWYNNLNERRKAHMDSYMTLPDYKNIDAAIAELNLTKELWMDIIKNCEHFAYLSMNSAILGIILKHKFFPETCEKSKDETNGN